MAVCLVFVVYAEPWRPTDSHVGILGSHELEAPAPAELNAVPTVAGEGPFKNIIQAAYPAGSGILYLPDLISVVYLFTLSDHFIERGNGYPFCLGSHFYVLVFPAEMGKPPNLARPNHFYDLPRSRKDDK